MTKPQPTKWNIEDYLTTPKQTAEFVLAAADDCKKLTEKDIQFILIVCRQVTEIAKKNGWLL